jgi:hypothetical protein
MKAVLFMSVVVGLVAGFCYVIADTEDKKRVFKEISSACFAGAFIAVLVL